MCKQSQEKETVDRSKARPPSWERGWGLDLGALGAPNSLTQSGSFAPMRVRGNAPQVVCQPGGLVQRQAGPGAEATTQGVRRLSLTSSNKTWSPGRWVRPQPPLPVCNAGYRWTPKRTWQCDHIHCLKAGSMALTAAFIAFSSSCDISCYSPTKYVQKLIHHTSSLKCHVWEISTIILFLGQSPLQIGIILNTCSVTQYTVDTFHGFHLLNILQICRLPPPPLPRRWTKQSQHPQSDCWATGIPCSLWLHAKPLMSWQPKWHLRNINTMCYHLLNVQDFLYVMGRIPNLPICSQFPAQSGFSPSLILVSDCRFSSSARKSSAFFLFLIFSITLTSPLPPTLPLPSLQSEVCLVLFMLMWMSLLHRRLTRQNLL